MSFSFFCASAAFLSEKLGGEVRMVGGAARDPLLFGHHRGDCDFAAAVPPETLRDALEDSGLPFKDTGAGHGGFTAELPCGERVEITCTRRDVACDGRRAETAFTPAWEEDARRRDFTVNALYVGGDGALYDYTGGMDDLARGALRFIGESQRRCREDYLRVLRFFRFLAELPLSPDSASLEACYDAAEGVPRLSRERAGGEFRRLAAGPRAGGALALLSGSPELWRLTGTPFSAAFAVAEAMRERERQEALYPAATTEEACVGTAAEAVMLAAAFVPGKRAEAAAAYADLHVFSKRERKQLATLMQESVEERTDEAAAADAAGRYGPEAALRILRIKLAIAPQAPASEAACFALWRETAARMVPFPLRAEDFLQAGVPAKWLGKALEAAKRAHRESGFRAEAEALLRAGAAAALSE